MINKPLPFKGLNNRIPSITPINKRGFIHHGFGLMQPPTSQIELKLDVDLRFSFNDADWRHVTELAKDPDFPRLQPLSLAPKSLFLKRTSSGASFA